MFAFFQTIDEEILVVLSQYTHYPLITTLFHFFSGFGSWGFIWIVIGGIVLLREKRDHRYFTALCLSIFISIVGVEEQLKYFWARSRPDLLLYPLFSTRFQLSTYSFPSTHATIAFAAAFILSQKHRQYWGLYYILAVLISFSRIYLGQHYPSDVLVGAFIGTGIGWISLRLVHWQRFYKKGKKE